MTLKTWEYEAIERVAGFQKTASVSKEELVNVGVLGVLKKKKLTGRYLSKALITTIARRRMMDYKIAARTMGMSGRGGSQYRRYRQMLKMEAIIVNLEAVASLPRSNDSTEHTAYLTLALEEARTVLGTELVNALIEGRTNEEIQRTVPGTRYRDPGTARRRFREILSSYGF